MVPKAIKFVNILTAKGDIHCTPSISCSVSSEMPFIILQVKSAAVSAFRTSYRPGDRSFTNSSPEQEKMSLQSLEIITDALLEIKEVEFSLVLYQNQSEEYGSYLLIVQVVERI